MSETDLETDLTPAKINYQFLSTEHRLGNQQDLDILAEYLGEHSEEFVFESPHVRAIRWIKRSDIDLDEQQVGLYLDLIGDTKDRIRLTLQVHNKSCIVGIWSLADPDGIENVRDTVRCAVTCLTHPAGENL